MRPDGKARRPRIPGVFEGGATQPGPGSPTRRPRWGGGGMQRRPNATGFVRRDTNVACSRPPRRREAHEDARRRLNRARRCGRARSADTGAHRNRRRDRLVMGGAPMVSFLVSTDRPEVRGLTYVSDQDTEEYREHEYANDNECKRVLPRLIGHQTRTRAGRCGERRDGVDCASARAQA
jgi:hypothetical protein